MEKPKVPVTAEHTMLYLQEMAKDRVNHPQLGTEILAAMNRAAVDVVEAQKGVIESEIRELKARLGEPQLKAVGNTEESVGSDG